MSFTHCPTCGVAWINHPRGCAGKKVVSDKIKEHLVAINIDFAALNDSQRLTGIAVILSKISTQLEQVIRLLESTKNDTSRN